MGEAKSLNIRGLHMATVPSNVSSRPCSFLTGGVPMQTPAEWETRALMHLVCSREDKGNYAGVCSVQVHGEIKGNH